MKAAAKTLKPKRQEEQANFVSWRFALLCGCILLALGFLLYREPLLGIPVFLVGEWLLAAAAMLTLWSGFEYARAAWPALRAEEAKGVDTLK